VRDAQVLHDFLALRLPPVAEEEEVVDDLVRVGPN
jgi:hypothetical protein